MPPVMAAFANALASATDERIRELPMVRHGYTI